MHILELVLRGLDLKATNPRDYIYGLHGVIRSTYVSDRESVRRLLLPDYSKSTSEAFRDFTLQWILCHDMLDILSAIHRIRGQTWQSFECTAAPRVTPHHRALSDHPT
jgi:hypothetical protein